MSHDGVIVTLALVVAAAATGYAVAAFDAPSITICSDGEVGTVCVREWLISLGGLATTAALIFLAAQFGIARRQQIVSENERPIKNLTAAQATAMQTYVLLADACDAARGKTFPKNVVMLSDHVSMVRLISEPPITPSALMCAFELGTDWDKVVNAFQRLDNFVGATQSIAIRGRRSPIKLIAAGITPEAGDIVANELRQAANAIAARARRISDGRPFADLRGISFWDPST